MKRVLLVGDCHHPYADMRAWNLMLETGPYDCVIQVGDFIDCALISDHKRSIHRLHDLEYELRYGATRLEELAQLAPERYLLEGNHEARLRDHAANKAPQLLPLLKSAGRYMDPGNQWKHVPYGEILKYGKLYATHDQGPSGEGAELKHARLVEHNVVFGHCHRLGVNYTGTVDGKRRFGCSVGWLGDRKKLAFKYAKQAQKAQWTLGFAVAEVSDSYAFVHPVPIVNYRIPQWLVPSSQSGFASTPKKRKS